MIESRIWANGPITQSSPMFDSPEIKLNGRTTVSRPIWTSASMNVLAGSAMVTPALIKPSRIRWRIARKGTRLNSSDVKTAYAVLCLEAKAERGMKQRLEYGLIARAVCDRRAQGRPLVKGKDC